MEYSIGNNTNNWILSYSQQISDDGLLGFCVCEITGNNITINSVYDNTDSCLSMSRKSPAWGEMNEFLEKNKYEGFVLPWVSIASSDRMKTLDPMLKYIGSDKAVVHLPGSDSIFLYTDRGLHKLPVKVKKNSGQGTFTDQFFEIYEKFDKSMRILVKDPKSAEKDNEINITPDYR